MTPYEQYEQLAEDETIWALIKRAFMDPDISGRSTTSGSPRRNEPRTLSGIASATGLPVAAINDYMERHPDRFDRLPVGIGGRSLYRLRGSDIEYLMADPFPTYQR